MHPTLVAPTEAVPYGVSPLMRPLALDDVIEVLDIHPQESRPAGSPVLLRNLRSGHGGILGAQLVGQQVVLAERLHPGKRVQSLQTLFVRSGRWEGPLEAHVERLAQGRSFASVSLTFRQGPELICKAQVLLTADESDPEPATMTARPGPGPQDGTPVAAPLLPWETRIATGGTWQEHDLWMRMGGVPDDPALWRALIAFGCEPTTLPLLVADRGAAGGPYTALLVAQTVTFFDHLDMRDWYVVRTKVPFSGGDRVHGHGEVLDSAGRPKALFTTVGLFRAAAG